MRHMLFATLVSLSITTGSVAAVPTACGTGAGIAAALQACIGQSVAIVFSVSSADPKRKALTGTVTAAAGDYVTIENRDWLRGRIELSSRSLKSSMFYISIDAEFSVKVPQMLLEGDREPGGSQESPSGLCRHKSAPPPRPVSDQRAPSGTRPGGRCRADLGSWLAVAVLRLRA